MLARELWVVEGERREKPPELRQTGQPRSGRNGRAETTIKVLGLMILGPQLKVLFCPYFQSYF